MVSDHRLLIMRSLSFMDQVVSGTMVGLCMVIVLIKPPARFERDSKEFSFDPDVTYRVERIWRMASEAEIAHQAQESWSETQIEHFIPIRFNANKWWISKKFDEMKNGTHIWYNDQQLQSQFKAFYRSDPRNWPLYDMGITRNGLPLPISDDLKYSIWQHQILRDQQTREIFRAHISWPLAFDAAIGSYQDQQEKLSQWLDYHRNENRDVHNTIQRLTDFSVDTFDMNIEAFYVYPYLLLIRDGKLIGTLGGHGQFDYIPDDWQSFRANNHMLLNK